MLRAGDKAKRLLSSPKAVSKKSPLHTEPEPDGPRRTRIFVKTCRGLVPIRVDLSWNGPCTIEKVGAMLAEVTGTQSTWSLLFRGKAIFTHRTLKDCGIELGSVLHLVRPRQPSSPFGARSAFRRGAFTKSDA